MSTIVLSSAGLLTAGACADSAAALECRMGRSIPGYGDTYDPDTMKLLARAFDAAWVEVRRDEASCQAEDS